MLKYGIKSLYMTHCFIYLKKKEYGGKKIENKWITDREQERKKEGKERER